MYPQDNICIKLSVDLQIEKGKLHGSIDVGLSVMAIKKKAKCIDLDAEENIYHLKVEHKANVPTDLQEVNLDWRRGNMVLLRLFLFQMPALN